MHEVEFLSRETDASFNPNPKSSGSLQKAKAPQNCLKKTIKDPSSVLIKGATATVGRCKRVQFHTLPELQRKNGGMKTFDEFDEKTRECGMWNFSDIETLHIYSIMGNSYKENISDGRYFLTQKMGKKKY